MDHGGREEKEKEGDEMNVKRITTRERRRCRERYRCPGRVWIWKWRVFS